MSAPPPWLQDFRKPLAPTLEEAEAYVSSELEGAVPPGWKVERYPDPGFPGTVRSLSWAVRRTDVPRGEWPNQEYGVQLAAGLDYVVFIHGNDDKGPRTVQQALALAMVIEAWELRRYGMTACLEHVMSNCSPNEWGYT